MNDAVPPPALLDKLAAARAEQGAPIGGPTNPKRLAAQLLGGHVSPARNLAGEEAHVRSAVDVARRVDEERRASRPIFLQLMELLDAYARTGVSALHS